jgi:hypothetical protein
MRYWLLTSTFYGNWLPGDRRGFVSRVRDARSGDDPQVPRREHDRYGEAYDACMPELERRAISALKGPTVRIHRAQADDLLGQFQVTASIRAWNLLAAAIMPDHVHWVIGLGDHEHGRDGLQDLKAYGSRTLNNKWGRPASGTWWTSKGSTRLLPDQPALGGAFDYVAYRQPDPLAVWIAPDLPPGISIGRTRQTDVCRS